MLKFHFLSVNNVLLKLFQKSNLTFIKYKQNHCKFTFDTVERNKEQP